MEQFTQKWAIVSLLEDADEGRSFYYTDFPLHVTLAGVFKISLPGNKIVDELEQLLANVHSFTIEADAKDMFGPNRDIAVTKIKTSSELERLHATIHARIVELGAEYNSPEYQGGGYVAHSTFQKSGKLTPGEKRRITTISLIDLLPNGDGYQRKIFKTVNLRQYSDY